LFNPPVDPALATLTSNGKGKMEITHGAIIEFDETKTNSGEPTNFTPKITLGEGHSIIDNSLIIGARDAARNDEIPQNNFDDVGLINGLDKDNNFVDNSLTFQNNAVLQGNLKIYMKEIAFDKSILSPGFSSYQFYMPSNEQLEHEKFGRIELKTEQFTQNQTSKIIIDFDVHGDRNYGKDPQKQTAYPLGGDRQPYADNKTYRGRDLIIVEKNGANPLEVTLAGDIYFRPQTGYYSDNVKVDFMRVDGNNVNIANATLHLYPYRWFKNEKLTKENVNTKTYVQLETNRNTTPFTDVAQNFNQYGVGGALNNIFNAQNNYNWLPILDWMWCMNDDELREAERLLSGEIKASSFYMPLRSPWRFGFDRINWSDNGHKISLCTPNCSDSDNQTTNPKRILWANAYYDYQHINNDHNSSNMSTQRVSIMTGYDRILPDSFNIGPFSDSSISFLFSYAQPKLDQKGNRIIANDYLAAFHSATRLLSTYELKSWIGIGTQTYRLHRTIPIPNIKQNDLSTNYKGNSLTSSIQIAKPIKWHGLTLRPHLALDLSYIKQYQTQENYNNEIIKQTALTYYSSDWTQLFTRTGIRLDYNKNYTNFNATLGYSYLLLGEQAPKTTHEFTHAGGGKFNILGNNLSRSFANIELGTKHFLNKNKTKQIYIQYNGNYSKYMNAHTTSIGYQKIF
jgi:hypothetical protein